MPELTRKCYAEAGVDGSEIITHASSDPDGRPVGFCGGCAFTHRAQTAEPIRVLGTTDWMKPATRREAPVTDLPSVGNEQPADE